MNPLERFDQFRLTDSDVEAMRSVFTTVLPNASFTRDAPLRRLLKTHKKVSGIYFWIARYESIEYKIYIGQTNSLANRLVNYVSEFQAHSTNDFKMRAFAAFLADIAPGAALDLYFSATDNHKEAEKHAINKYDPLLNKLPSPSPEAREKLKCAFEFYYRSTFELRLAK